MKFDKAILQFPDQSFNINSLDLRYGGGILEMQWFAAETISRDWFTTEETDYGLPCCRFKVGNIRVVEFKYMEIELTIKPLFCHQYVRGHYKRIYDTQKIERIYATKRLG